MKNKKLEAVIILLFISAIGYGAIYGICVLMESITMSGVKTPEECKELVGFIGDSPDDDQRLELYPEMRGMSYADSCLEGLRKMNNSFSVFRAFIPIMGAVFLPLSVFGIVWPNKDDDKPYPKTKRCFCGDMIEDFRTCCGNDLCRKKYDDLQEKKTAPFFPYYFIIVFGGCICFGVIIISFIFESSEILAFIGLGGLIMLIFGRIPLYLKERKLRAKYSKGDGI